MDFALVVFKTAAALFALAVLTIAILLAGRRYQRGHNGLRAAGSGPLTLTPRFSPVGPDFQGSDEHWLALAGEVCQQHNRGLGVIAVRVVDSEDPDVAPPHADLAACVANLTREFAAVLRPSDMISARGGSELIIGVPFVSEKANVQSVAARLKGVFDRVAESSGIKARAEFGISMYPQDGATGGELIQCAQHDAERNPNAASLALTRAEGKPLIIAAARSRQ